MLRFKSWIASQYCNSWTCFSLVCLSGKKHQSIFSFTWTLAARDFKILKPSQEFNAFSLYHIPTREFTLSKPASAGVNDWQAPNERDAWCGVIMGLKNNCCEVRTRRKRRLWPHRTSHFSNGLQVAHCWFSGPPKDTCRVNSSPPLLLLFCPQVKAALPAALPNHAGWAEALRCPLQLFWLHYKKLLHCRNASLASQVHYALTVEELPAVSICEQLI